MEKMETPKEKSSEKEKNEKGNEKARGIAPREDKEPTLLELKNFMSMIYENLSSRMNDLEENKSSHRASRAGSVAEDLLQASAPRRPSKDEEFSGEEYLTNLSMIEATRSQRKFIKRANSLVDEEEIQEKEEDIQGDDDEEYDAEDAGKKSNKDKKTQRKKEASMMTTKKRVQKKKSATTPDPSSGGSSDSSSSSSEDSTSKRKPSGKRDSILRRAVRGAANPLNRVQYTQPMPPHTIHLNNLSVQAIHRFLNDIAAYQASYSVRLPVSTLIHQVVKDHLIANSKGKLTETNFHVLRGQKLLTILQKEIMPRDKLSFYKLMDRNVKFEINLNGYKPSTIIDFQPLYNAILVYKRKFITVFELLSEKNDEDNIPAIENKDNGLIQLFNSKIDFNYGRNVWASLKNKRFDTLYLFDKAFTQELQKDYETYVKAKTMQQKFSGSALLQQNKM